MKSSILLVKSFIRRELNIKMLFCRYRLYYSQTKPLREGHLEMVNWWNDGKGLFQHPTVPITKSIYADFKGEYLQVPVLNASCSPDTAPDCIMNRFLSETTMAFRHLLEYVQYRQ